MSFSDQRTIRQDIADKLWPLLDKHHGVHNVLSYDVGLQSLPQANGQMVVVWCIVICASGALIGPEYSLSYVYTFQGGTPQMPSDLDLEKAVRHVFQQLTLMKNRQLQQAAPPQAN